MAAKEDIFSIHIGVAIVTFSSHRPITAGIKIICEVGVAVVCDLWATVLWYCVAGRYVRDTSCPRRSEVDLTSHGWAALTSRHPLRATVA